MEQSTLQSTPLPSGYRDYLEKVPVLGFQVANVSRRDILSFIASAIESSRTTTIACLNAHYAEQAVNNSLLTHFYRSADLVHSDGILFKWTCEVLNPGVKLRERIVGTDLYDDILAEADRRQWRVFLFGDKKEIVASAAFYLQRRYPRIHLTGFHHGYVDLLDEGPLQMIERSRPQLLFVGLGQPRQEQWLLKYRSRLNVPVCIAVGAGIAYLSQKLPRAPRWMQDAGLEWLFRLLVEPRRLWRRYLIGAPVFIIRVMSAMMRHNQSVRVGFE
jgi:N-acetylglucosaminyldiphosphoundecaprenol N-acetyl-beta-D-mannosaminyltransferase